MGNIERIEWAIRAAAASTKHCEVRNRIEDIQIYFEDEEYVLLGNWNAPTKWNKNSARYESLDGVFLRMVSVLENIGCELRWEDEWTSTSCCGRLVRTQPDGWGWKPEYVIQDGDLICEDCLDAESYLESIERTCNNANSLSFDPSDHGYVLVADFERGFHRGQDSDPMLIGKLMDAAGFDRWLFSIDSTGMFDTKFSLWIHDAEAEQDDGDGLILAKRTIERGITDGPSISEGIKNQLMGLKIPDPTPGMVTISKVTPEGAETYQVSDEDFIKGNSGL